MVRKSGQEQVTVEINMPEELYVLLLEKSKRTGAPIDLLVRSSLLRDLMKAGND